MKSSPEGQKETEAVLNKVMLIGNLGKDPEMSYTPSGKANTRFSLAVNRRGAKGEDGKRDELTQWFNIQAWEGLAETCNTYLHKGSKVYIEGRIGSRKYTDKEGREREIWEVICTQMEMLDTKSAHGDDRDAPPPGDDLPF